MKSFALITHGDTLIAKGIQAFSYIYEGFGKNTKADKMYNHALIVYQENHIWWYQEALSNGISNPKPFGSSTYYKAGNFVVKTLKEEISHDNLIKAINWAKSVSGISYDFLGIGAWMVKTFTNKWIGKTGKASEKALYCSEFTEDFFNILQPNTFVHPWEDSPMNLYDNQAMEFIENSVFYDTINNKIPS